MAKIEEVWCVRGCNIGWHATQTGRKPMSNRRRVRAMCGTSIEVFAEPIKRWPDCRHCLDSLCARAQRAARKTEVGQSTPLVSNAGVNDESRDQLEWQASVCQD